MGKDCFHKEGEDPKVRCQKCSDQRKGCYWQGEKAIVKGKAKSSMPPPAAGPTIHISPPKAKSTRKRKQSEVSPEVESSLPPPPRPQVVVPIRPRPRSNRVIPSTSPSSPAPFLSTTGLPTGSALFSPAPSDPPPSAVSSARSAPATFPSATPAWSSGSFTVQSQGLEVRILRAQLDTANKRFEREQERSRLEVESLRAEFASEREAYQDHIIQLESLLGQK